MGHKQHRNRKHRIKGRKTTTRKVVNNLLRYYALTTTGDRETHSKWYYEANAFCEQLGARYGHETWKVAGIVAALSPQSEWTQNKIWARTFIINRGAGFIHSLDKTLKCKAIFNATHPYEVPDILSKKPKGALKTKAFYRNIVLPDYCDTCTIDRHAIATAVQRPDKTRALTDKEARITPSQYYFLQECYILAARKVGMIPSSFQALLWVTYRKQRGLQKPPVSGGFQPMDIEDF